MKLTLLLSYVLRVSLVISVLLLILFDSWIVAVAVLPVLALDYYLHKTSTKKVMTGLFVILLVIQIIVFGILGIKFMLFEEESNYFLESLKSPEIGGNGFVDQMKASYNDLSFGNISSRVHSLRYSASKAIVDGAKKSMHHSLGVVDKTLSQYRYITDLISLFGDKGAIPYADTDAWNQQGSAAVIRSVFGVVPNTTFPDLRPRSRKEVRTSLRRIFEDLPSEAFSDKYVNPCWETEIKSNMKNDIEATIYKGVDVEISQEHALHCLPAFYILGQPKSGTTDLYSRLSRHHDIHSPKKKEIRWFTRGEFSFQKYKPNEIISENTTIHEYTNYFTKVIPQIKHNPSRAITLDGGPHTFWWPLQAPDGSDAPPEMIPTPQIIREITPKSKFLITLSNPVDRMYSDYYFLNDDRHLADNPRRGGLRGSKKKNSASETIDSLANKSPEKFHERALQQVKNFRTCVSNQMNSSTYMSSVTGDAAAAIETFLNADFGHETKLLVGMSSDVREVVVGRWFRAAQICAHDRHSFGAAGWGRLSIGLYSIYYEKWLEHFSPSQFKFVRLEDYDSSPKEYLKDIFAFLQVDMPIDEDEWNSIIGPAVKNKHRADRLPMLAETRVLLEQFYRPYNILLAKALRDRRFSWSEYRHHAKDNHNPESILHRTDAEHSSGSPNVGVDNSTEKVSHKTVVEFRPKSFALDGLQQPSKSEVDESADDNSEEFNTFVREIVHRRDHQPSPLDFKDHTGFEEVCAASYGLDFAALKYLLYEVGVPATVVNSHRVTPLHCLAAVYTMSEATSKSLLFSMLKDEDSWLSPMIGDAMPKYAKSVRSMDIMETLDPATAEVAKWLVAAGADVNSAVAFDSHTPLHLACIGGLTQLAQYLLEQGADPDYLNIQNKSPLAYCLAYGHVETGALLIKHGASLDLMDIHGVTPRSLVESRGVISEDDALKYFNITQTSLRTISRPLHPSYPSSAPDSSRDNGGWNRARLPGFENDMHCDVDQYEFDEISAVELFEQYIARQRPVLLRAGARLASDWGALVQYSRDVLLKMHGDEVVTASSIPYSDKFGGSPSESLTIAEYVREMTYHNITGGSHPFYVFKGNPIEKVNKLIDGNSVVNYDIMPTPVSIAKAFNYLSRGPNYVKKEIGGYDNSIYRNMKLRKDFINAQWALGGAGSGAPIHFHNTAWNALIYGAKKWFLYPPHNMIMSNVQILEFIETDMKSYGNRNSSRFNSFKPLTCVQTSGDIMIAPESWGHGVLNIQDSIAVATESRNSLWRIKQPLPFSKTLVELSPQAKRKRRKKESLTQRQ